MPNFAIFLLSSSLSLAISASRALTGSFPTSLLTKLDRWATALAFAALFASVSSLFFPLVAVFLLVFKGLEIHSFQSHSITSNLSSLHVQHLCSICLHPCSYGCSVFIVQTVLYLFPLFIGKIGYQVSMTVGSPFPVILSTCPSSSWMDIDFTDIPYLSCHLSASCSSWSMLTDGESTMTASLMG